MNPQGGSFNPQGGSGGILLQGSSPVLQSSNTATQQLQPTVNPMNLVDPVSNTSTQTLGANTTVDPAAAAAAAKAAADAAKAASLRGQVSDLVNQINSIFDSRYGQVDALAGEQSGKLNDRFANESKDLTTQIEGENQKIGAAHAAGGTYDSSYRGNNVDTVTHAGQGQIRDLGQELQDNIAKIAAWVAGQKGSFTAQKGGYDAIASHLAEETDPGRLTDLRNTITQKLADLQGGSADYNTAGANAQALASIAPSSTRAVQLKTTLSQIVAGNADPSQKSAIGQSLITNSGLDPSQQQQLLLAFQSDLTSKPQVDANGQPVTSA